MKTKKPKYNLISPQVDPVESLHEHTLWEIEADEIYQASIFRNCHAGSNEARHVTVENTVLDRVSLAGAQLESLIFRDIKAEKCDMANLQGLHSKLIRCEILDSRATGVNLSESRIESVLFKGLRADMATFFQTEFINCKFVECDLSGADFRDAKLKGAIFQSCKMPKALFHGANLNDARFPETNLEEVNIGINELKGIVMTKVQVLDNSLLLAKLLEIKVDC